MKNTGTTMKKEAIDSFNNSMFGRLVKDLMDRKPGTTQAQAIRETARTHPEEHDNYLRSIGWITEGAEKSNVNATFEESRLGIAAKALLDDGQFKTMGEAIAHVTRKRPDFVDEYINAQGDSPDNGSAERSRKLAGVIENNNKVKGTTASEPGTTTATPMQPTGSKPFVPTPGVPSEESRKRIDQLRSHYGLTPARWHNE